MDKFESLQDLEKMVTAQRSIEEENGKKKFILSFHLYCLVHFTYVCIIDSLNDKNNFIK